MLKAKKILLIILPIVITLLVLITPIPKTEQLSDGSTLTLNSLTYKAVFWDMFKSTKKPYNKAEIFFLPNNFTDTQLIWEEKEHNLRVEGYGAITGIFTVKEISNGNLIVNELTNDKNAIEDCIIADSDIKEYGANISFEEISVGTTVEITYDGSVLLTSPCMLGRIYKIKAIGEKNFIPNSSTQNSEPTASQTQTPQENISSNNETSSANGVIEDAQNNSSQETPSSNTNSTVSQDSDIYVPMFWEQKMHRYDDYYDEISKIHIPYRVIEPQNYDPNKEYPVILFLHGAGYRYGSTEDVDFNELQVLTLASSFTFNYEWTTKAIIVAPQISKNDWWDFGPNLNGSLDAAMRIFEKVTSEYSCDSNRYYVTGGSMGGYATWQIAVKYNNIFAAAMPMCGWWNPNDATHLKDMPIRIIHGTADTTVSIEKSKSMYNAIKSAGGQKVVLSLYEGAEHDVWREAYFDAETWEWLFAQKRE